ncbi:MAG: hypothetical protein ABR616_18805 [Dermatophilaceae bacterium]|nr:hypothetical protein [Intrasporangiaceae bacterium]
MFLIVALLTLCVFLVVFNREAMWYVGLLALGLGVFATQFDVGFVSVVLAPYFLAVAIVTLGYLALGGDTKDTYVPRRRV